MKLTLSLLTILSCALYSVDANFPKIKKTLHHHPSDPIFDLPTANQNLHHLPLPPLLDQVPTLPKRNNFISPKSPLRTPNPSSPPTPNFLPPPWSPASNLDSPYPLTGVSPYDDTGRSEILDNEPSVQTTWRTCPASTLDCTKCPRDKRCRHPDTPWWQVDATIEIEDGGVVADMCPLTACTASPAGCGSNAKCVRDHCVCETGWKARTGNVRGLEGLQAVTVWVGGGVDCDVQCEGWGCEEVQQVGGCFGLASVRVAGVDGVETGGAGGGTGDGEASRVRRGQDYCGV